MKTLTKPTARKISLTRETLRRLTAGELGLAAGGRTWHCPGMGLPATFQPACSLDVELCNPTRRCGA
jgi:hypothetical protein